MSACPNVSRTDLINICGFYTTGSLRDESEYLFDLVFAASSQDEYKRTSFHYKIGPVPVCRDAFCIALGLTTKNARFAKYETMVRSGASSLPAYSVGERQSNNMQALCAQYVAAYILIHSEKSPVDCILYLERQKLAEVYRVYIAHFGQQFCVKFSTFRKVWYKQLKEKIADPASSCLYTVKLRKRRAVGFKRCDVCSELQFNVMMAPTTNDRLKAKNKLHEHLQKVLNCACPTTYYLLNGACPITYYLLNCACPATYLLNCACPTTTYLLNCACPTTYLLNCACPTTYLLNCACPATTYLLNCACPTTPLIQVKANRTGLQAARTYCNGRTIVGFSIDAADYGKFLTPTTKSTAKQLGGMQRIKNKITGVEFFSGERKLLLFRTLPNITTGANLTLTILTR